jgi:hypothetical protein
MLWTPVRARGASHLAPLALAPASQRSKSHRPHIEFNCRCLTSMRSQYASENATRANTRLSSTSVPSQGRR